MPRVRASDLVAARLRERGRTGGRFVDLQLDVVDGRTGEVVLAAGGRWDRRSRCYVDEAKTSRVLSVHPGQLESVEWFDEWLGDHVAGVKRPEDERIYSALLSGGQRAGKTWVAVDVCALAYALACPGSIVWLVAPSDRDYDELEDLLAEAMPRDWYSKRGSPKFVYELINGSRIFLRSGHEPGALKKGRADLIVMNEGQRMVERAFVNCRGRIADRGGVVLCCANPPDRESGQWVSDWAVEAEAGLRQAKSFYMSPLENPHIDHAALRAMETEVDERTFDVEVLGKHVGTLDAVIHNWSRTENERIVPESAVEITREFLRFKEGGRIYDRAVGVDVQKQPMVAVEYRFFENPLARIGRERFDYCHAWITSEVVLDGASEEDLALAWLELGWDPARTLVICDASGAWQFAERDPLKVKQLREQVRGRGSFDVFRKMGFRHVVKPDHKLEKNPEIIERVRATTSRVCTKTAGEYGQRFLYCDPRCRRTVRSIRKWQNKHGRPMRDSQHAHFGDAVSYPMQRLFPRRFARTSTDIKVFKVHKRREQLRGW